MSNKINRRKITKEEWRNADNAISEEEQTGKTERRCLVCGSKYHINYYGTSYVITCETDGCFQFTSRGI